MSRHKLITQSFIGRNKEKKISKAFIVYPSITQNKLLCVFITLLLALFVLFIQIHVNKVSRERKPLRQKI